MSDFISEEDLETFEGWLQYQGVAPTTSEELETWLRLFEEVRQRSAASPKVGRGASPDSSRTQDHLHLPERRARPE